MVSFVELLAHDPSLRDAFVAFVDAGIAVENSLDRVDTTHSVDHQRGRVAQLRSLKAMTVGLERPKDEGDSNGTVR